MFGRKLFSGTFSGQSPVALIEALFTFADLVSCDTYPSASRTYCFYGYYTLSNLKYQKYPTSYDELVAPIPGLLVAMGNFVNVI